MLVLLSFLWCFVRFDWHIMICLGLLVRLGGLSKFACLRGAAVWRLISASSMWCTREMGTMRLQATKDLSRRPMARIVSSDVIRHDLSLGMLQPSVSASGDAEVAIFGVNRAERGNRNLDSKRAILCQWPKC